MKHQLLLATALICLAASPTLAQNDNTLPRRHLGIGIHSSIFQTSDLDLTNIPPNRLIVQYDFMPTVRAELQVGGYNKETKESGNNLVPTDDALVASLGGFYLIPYEQAKFSVGARYRMGNMNNEEISYETSTDPYVYNNKQTISSVSGVIGGEYFFSKWFSVGAEFSLIYDKNKCTTENYSSSYTIPETTTTSTLTETSLLFRFYLN